MTIFLSSVNSSQFLEHQIDAGIAERVAHNIERSYVLNIRSKNIQHFFCGNVCAKRLSKFLRSGEQRPA